MWFTQWALLMTRTFRGKEQEDWALASCQLSLSQVKWVATWTLLAWLVATTTTSPIPRAPLHTFRWEAFPWQPLHGDAESLLAFPAVFQEWHPTRLCLPLCYHVHSPYFCPFPRKHNLTHRKIGSGWQYPFYREVNWGSERKPSCLINNGNERSYVWSTPVLYYQTHDISLKGTVPGQKDQRCPTMGVYTAKKKNPKCLWIWCWQNRGGRPQDIGTLSCVQDILSVHIFIHGHKHFRGITLFHQVSKGWTRGHLKWITFHYSQHFITHWGWLIFFVTAASSLGSLPHVKLTHCTAAWVFL